MRELFNTILLTDMNISYHYCRLEPIQTMYNTEQFPQVPFVKSVLEFYVQLVHINCNSMQSWKSLQQNNKWNVSGIFANQTYLQDNQDLTLDLAAQ